MVLVVVIVSSGARVSGSGIGGARWSLWCLVVILMVMIVVNMVVVHSADTLGPT